MPTILYEDRHLLLVEKPIGLSSQLVEGGNSLPHQLEQAGYPVKPVHRLDKPTGGVMVYARTDQAAAKLSTLVGQHDRFQKEYLAVVQGCPGKANDTLTDLLYHDVRRNKSFVVNRPRKGVREAVLDYTVLETCATNEGTFSLIQVRLHTGRTHQIRVQFASRKMPLYGDSRYGGIKSQRLGLWSHRLTLPHPLTGKALFAESQPDWSITPWCYFKKI
ncbi:MAG: RluA family pseudouridine synthase [Ruminococcaceae bacterium]|nr:RluA family pseudouridine synthase [Oscillospiraceae bacterium]